MGQKYFFLHNVFHDSFQQDSTPSKPHEDVDFEFEESTETPQTVYSCQECDMQFTSSIARNSHRRKEHQHEHLCSHCNIAFESGQKLDQHLKTHTEVKQYKCITCGKEFKCETNLRLHSKLHLGQKDYVCSFCDRSYFTNSGLQSHIKQMHSSDDQRVYSCHMCDLTLPSKHELVMMVFK